MTTENDSNKKKEELFPVTVSKWNDVIEKNIKEIGESCKGYKWMHISCARSSSKRYAILIYATIFIPPIGALLGTIASIKNSDALQILEIICGVLGGVLATVVKYGKFHQRSGDHKNAAAKYASLEGNIRRQLSLYRDDRVNAGKYLQWVSTSFEDLFAGSPLVPGSVYNKWVKLAEKDNLYIPKEYGLTIEIDSREKIQGLCNVGEIKVNQHESNTNLATLTVVKEEKEDDGKSGVANITTPERRISKVFGKETLKRNNQTLRTDEYTVYPELNKYDDAMMSYEMGRMFGFQQK